MPSKSLKILLTTVVLFAAFSALLWTSMQDSMHYFKEVAEVAADPAEWEGRPLKLHGYAANVLRHSKSLDWRFEITDSVENPTYVMNAVYSGIVPDSFNNHADVVATGRLVGDTFHIDPDGIMAKCPSKYEEKPVVGTAGAGYVSATGGASN